MALALPLHGPQAFSTSDSSSGHSSSFFADRNVYGKKLLKKYLYKLRLAKRSDYTEKEGVYEEARDDPFPPFTVNCVINKTVAREQRIEAAATKYTLFRLCLVPQSCLPLEEHCRVP